MTQLTIRFRDPELERCVRNEAQRRDTSLNKAALALMRKGAGMPISDERPLTVGNALDRFFGSWSAEEERVVLEAVAELDEADDSFSHTMESGAWLLTGDGHFESVSGLAVVRVTPADAQ